MSGVPKKVEFMKSVNTLNQQVDSFLRKGLQNKYALATLLFVSIAYGVVIAPKPPAFLMSVFNNTLFKILFFTLIAILAQLNFGVALLMAVSFIVLINSLGEKESFADFKREANTSGLTMLDPRTAIEHGCKDMTLQDLERAFGNDNKKLQETVKFAYKELLRQLTDKTEKQRLMYLAYAVGLPHNVQFNDENAPYIASMLIQWGFYFNEKCNEKAVGSQLFA
jgi:hypothetical protein